MFLTIRGEITLNVTITWAFLLQIVLTYCKCYTNVTWGLEIGD